MSSEKTTFDIAKRVQFHAQGELKLPNIKGIKASGGYLTWGDDNLYPQYLINLFYNSALHGGIIKQKVDWIAGNGLYSASANVELQQWIKKCNRKGDSLNEIFKKCATDYELFGGFCLQIIYTKRSTVEKPEIAEIYYTDISKYRYNLDADKIKYSREWERWKAKVIEYDIYNDSNPEGTQVFYYNGCNTREWYPVPNYIGCVTGIETDIEIANYQLSVVKAGFFPSISIDFKTGEPTEEEKSFMNRTLQNLWGGTGNAGKMFLTFSDADSPGPDIKPIQQPDLDTRFLQSADYTMKRILQGHNMPPVLQSIQEAGKLGLGNEYNDAFQKFQNAYVEPAQTILLSLFNNLCSINYPDSDLQILLIRPIATVWMNEEVMASQMTTMEVREHLVKQGVLTNAQIPDDESVIAFKDYTRIPMQPSKPDDNTASIDSTQQQTGNANSIKTSTNE